MSTMRFLQSLATGTATGVAPAGAVAGPAIQVNDNQGAKVRDLSALLTLDAETNTITMSVRFQGSNDKSTWFDLATSPQNAAPVAILTGTAGADTAATRSFEAPQGVYSYKWARWSLVIGVVTGTDNDTYEGSYNYRALSAADRSLI